MWAVVQLKKKRRKRRQRRGGGELAKEAADRGRSHFLQINSSETNNMIFRKPGFLSPSPNHHFEFGVCLKLVRLIKMCLKDI